AVVHLVLGVDSAEQLLSPQGAKIPGGLFTVVDQTRRRFRYHLSRVSEQLFLRARTVDRFGTGKLLQLVHLFDLVRREIPEEVAERNQVHQVQIPGQRRVLHSLELKGAIDGDVDRLNISGASESLDGEHVAYPKPVELQQRSKLLVEEVETPLEVRVVHVEEMLEQGV